MTDPEQLRISDADRHRVAEVLRDAAGEGRLDLDELEERLEATYAAKVYADLVPIVADLPGAPPPAQGPARPSLVKPPAQHPSRPPVSRPGAGHLPAHGHVPRHDSSVSVMSGVDRRGVWEIGSTHTALAVMAGIELDLREAVFASHEVLITANAVMAGIDIIVDAHTHVVVDGVGIMGAFEEGRAKVEPELGPDSPVVRVRGVALMGAVTVTRKPPPKPKRKLLGRHGG